MSPKDSASARLASRISLHDTLRMKLQPLGSSRELEEARASAAQVSQIPTFLHLSCIFRRVWRSVQCAKHGNDWGGSGDHCDEFGVFGSGLDFRLLETGRQEEVWKFTGSR